MCAIFGIVGDPEAAKLSYLGLHALQHRGQEGAGIISTDGETPYIHRRKGYVGDIFNQNNLQKLKGHMAIGHTRYSTTGGNTLANLQPLWMKSGLGWISLAHNGNLVNAESLTLELEKQGSLFQSTNDTEVIIHLMARSGKPDIQSALISALSKVSGAYSLLLMTEKEMIVVRDPRGFRPLIMGKLREATVFASESTAFDLMGAKYIREVEPGEMIRIALNRPDKMESHFPLKPEAAKRCIFEYVYFARPDSNLYGKNVHEVRKGLGRQLAAEHPAPGADIVIPIPDSGVPGAIGFSEASEIPFDMGIIRSHYIGRTFIEPQQSIRDFGVKLKLRPVKECVDGKSVVVVDDSLVRGTTSKKLIQHLREAGAKSVHMRITAPPTKHPCFYGIDTPTKKELVASSQSTEEIRKFIGADTLGYLSLAGLIEASSSANNQSFCHACFSGDYPTAII